MRILLAMSMALICALSLFADQNDTAKKIRGTWEVLDVTSVNVMDSPPRGLPACKHYYAPDGKLYVLTAEEKLNPKTQFAACTFSNDVRILKTPEGKEIRTRIDFPGTNTMRYLMDEGREVWTLRRMSQDKAYDLEIEPRSVVVLRVKDSTKQPNGLTVKYDTNDYSKLPLGKRCVGVWEAIAYNKIPPQEMPPYGFPNEKYVFTEAGGFFKLDPEEAAVPTNQFKYKVDGQAITAWNPDSPDKEKTTFDKTRFDKWGRMVLANNDMEITLKLLQRRIAGSPVLPRKICLLELTSDDGK